MPDSTVTMQREAALDPLQIEKTLSTLWKDYSRQAVEAGSVAARARLANLVSFCRNEEEAEAASGAVAKLNAVRPVRSLIVTAEARDGTQEAGAALKCGITGGRNVCYEEIALNTPGDSADALPALVEPLTVPDLPTYLWSPGDAPLDDPHFARLLPVVDRVVTDSHHFADPLARFRRLNELVQQYRGACVFTEMTWTRLGTWREAVGKVFDPPENRALLPLITKVVITSAHGAGEPSDRAILMTGWLASKLGWSAGKTTPGTPWRASFTSATQMVDVEWREGSPTARGHLLEIELTAGDTVVRVGRLQNDPSGAIRSVVVRNGQEEVGPAYNPLHWLTSELLCNALEIRSPFTDWEDTLRVVAGLAG